MAQYGHTTNIHGGVGAPVGLTVFKTAGGSLGAVPGGFDSHTPLPKFGYAIVRICLLTHGFADSARLCFPFFPPKLCSPSLILEKCISLFTTFVIALGERLKSALTVGHSCVFWIVRATSISQQ